MRYIQEVSVFHDDDHAKNRYSAMRYQIALAVARAAKSAGVKFEPSMMDKAKVTDLPHDNGRIHKRVEIDL